MRIEHNPYSPPMIDVAPVLPPGRGWCVLAVVLYSVGGLSLALGLFAGTLTLLALTFVGTSDPRLPEVMAAFSLHLAFAIAWFVAGRFFSTGRLRFGLVATLAGLAIPAGLFAILGY